MRPISNTTEYQKALEIEEKALEMVRLLDHDIYGVDERFEKLLKSAEKAIKTARELRTEFDKNRF